MNTQTFQLRAFFERGAGSFDEQDLGKVVTALPLAEDGPWLAGGALRRAVRGEALSSDFDLFFRSGEQLSHTASVLESRGFAKVRESEHHEHWRGDLAGAVRDVQLIRFRFYDSPADALDSFDFTICQFATDGQRLTAGEFALFDTARKRLVVHTITYPVSTMRRLLKYQKQGYWACSGALTEILARTIATPELHQQLEVAYVD